MLINSTLIIYKKNMAINKKSNKKFFAKIGVYREKLESLITLKFRLVNSQTISF